MQISRHWRMNAQRYRLEDFPERIEKPEQIAEREATHMTSVKPEVEDKRETEATAA